MKILKIVSSGFEQGGVENGIVLTNRILRARGHEVRVISSDSFPDEVHYSDAEFRHVPVEGLGKIVSTAFNLDAYRVTKRVLREFRPDVVLLHTMQQTSASVLYSLRDTPTILFVHGPEAYVKALLPWHLAREDYRGDSYALRDLTLSGWLHYAYFRWVCGAFYKVGLRNVDVVVGLSRYTQRILEQQHLEAIYLRNGAQLNESARTGTRVGNVLYAGRLEKYKGVDDLVRAMADVVRHVPGATLTIAGNGSFRPELEQLVRALELEDTVEFVGHLDHDAMASAYADASLFVLPSTWPETFGKVGIEAMSLGKPVVATDVGGVTDWLEDDRNGVLVRPHAPAELAAAITRVLSDPALYARYAAYARESARHFSMEAFAERQEALILEVVKDAA